ncbi:peptide chain release factor N(5)-glutamine methyltransferase [Candidatus Nitrosacidococcus sp. I8]|uniref:peptide chain release factor N(5)-glutamine methyltransferase n=1 Tax=Candidatus Nitrosacidococcus sp. I8 TaxID=2942908 RepID=UPI00222766B3|nr:peptide chain release factor N(5)-glutamine methyltransferase [Candidatus Nitrosacidococcus sp. I8]CAH9019671.1 Release factor glutamine methyltransferase [Candidatus Nitrosacidococcus sp. I8]
MDQKNLLTVSHLSISIAIAETKKYFTQLECGHLEAERLISWVLQKNRSYLYTYPNQLLTSTQQKLLLQVIQRRLSHEPLAYILEEQGFWSFTLKVNRATLIPRPETELLVSFALEKISNRSLKIADLGTGSGAIALAIASECPQAQIIATDISMPALEIAQINKENLKLSNITFRQGDWFNPIQGEIFEVIVSNPPYIDKEDPHLTLDGLWYEPRQALVADNKGLQTIYHIAEKAREYLAPEGWLLIEHGYNQGIELVKFFTNLGYQQVIDFQDLAGQPRVIIGQWYP